MMSEIKCVMSLLLDSCGKSNKNLNKSVGQNTFTKKNIILRLLLKKYK